MHDNIGKILFQMNVNRFPSRNARKFIHPITSLTQTFSHTVNSNVYTRILSVRGVSSLSNHNINKSALQNHEEWKFPEKKKTKKKNNLPKLTRRSKGKIFYLDYVSDKRRDLSYCFLTFIYFDYRYQKEKLAKIFTNKHFLSYLLYTHQKMTISINKMLNIQRSTFQQALHFAYHLKASRR